MIFFFSAKSGGFFFWRCLEQALPWVIKGILPWNTCQCFLGGITHSITCLSKGFETAHKLQRQLYTRTTSHDSLGNSLSCKLDLSANNRAITIILLRFQSALHKIF